jgi:DNA-3-methyladenine glycosylase I
MKNGKNDSREYPKGDNIMQIMTDNKTRCPWGDTWASCKEGDPQMWAYHDKEWGKPCRDERKLFEMLTLEGAQAGLAWATILRKRENYCAAFDDWNIAKIAAYNECKIAGLLANPGIIRNRLKILSAVTNAQAVQRLGSLSAFIWQYVDGKPIDNKWTQMSEIPTKTELSNRISRDMKKLGFKFVGSTIIYSYLQAIGMVNDHIVSCEFREYQVMDNPVFTISNSTCCRNL